MGVNFEAPVQKVISPSKLAHIVLRTANFEKMVGFYKDFLGATAVYENPFLSFLTYDEEHHRIAIACVPGTSPKIPTSSGLEHIAFTFDNLEDLALAYVQRKAKGITPYWSVNHGPTTSIYYSDPDGNNIETQVDNLSVEDATELMRSPAFAENPIGVDFDADELVQKLKDGADQEKLKIRANIGPRGIESAPSAPAITV
jgi:catechol-2,3-dioxygenase